MYVSNRVIEIRNLCQQNYITINYVSTKINPADLITRGCTYKQLDKSNLWKHGPSLDTLVVNVDTDTHTTHICEIITEVQPLMATPPLIDLIKFSKFSKAQSVSRHVSKFVKSNLSPLEFLVRQEQRLHTPSLFAYVSDIRTVVTPDIKQTAEQLNLFLSKGVMRCQTRLTKSDLNEDTHIPLFLPRKSLLAQLYIQYLHNSNRHCSTTQTMTFYRQKLWTPKLRPLVSSIIRRCNVCQILRSSAATQPPPPVLPNERVRLQHPYACVGVDNTGAFPVRGTVEGRRYITIFVCTTSRHVHLEVTNSLSTEDFLHAFRRFASIYGTPAKILSDNGRNFLGASRCLAEAGKKEEFRRYMSNNNIDWHFQTPRAPWKGGHFERLIGTVKTSLIVSLRHKKLNKE